MIELRPPYPGLRSFQPDEADLFFGRDRCTTAMIDKLAETRFLSVLGNSGSGKSSLVRTGLLEGLLLGLHPTAAAWKIAEMRPGVDPFRNLARAMSLAVNSAATDEDVAMLEQWLKKGPRAVREWVAAGNLPRGCSILLLVDQFEELFRYRDYGQREDAEAFATLLIESADDPDAPIALCLTMRSEYLGACGMVARLAERISDGMYLAPRMTREETREAITGPARVCDVELEPALVNQVLNDLAMMAPWENDTSIDQFGRLSQRADQLPLMQHVLNRLWGLAVAAQEDPDDEVRLTRASYLALGGLGGALTSHGREVYEALPEAARANRAPERVFRSLIAGETLSSAVRRPRRFGELVKLAGVDAAIVSTIVDAYRAPGCNFLMPPLATPLGENEPLVDISHESLIRQWDMLREWFAIEAEDGAEWRSLLSRLREYERSRELLSGPALAAVRLWWERECPSIDWAQRHGGHYTAVAEFYQKSIEAEEEARAESERKSEREKRRLRFQVAAASILAIAASGMAATAMISRNQATEAQLQAERSRESAIHSQAESERNRQIAASALIQAKATNEQLQVSKSREEQEKKKAQALAVVAKNQADNVVRAFERLSQIADDDAHLGPTQQNKVLQDELKKFRAQMDARGGQQRSALDVFRSQLRLVRSYRVAGESLPAFKIEMDIWNTRKKLGDLSRLDADDRKRLLDVASDLAEYKIFFPGPTKDLSLDDANKIAESLNGSTEAPVLVSLARYESVLARTLDETNLRGRDELDRRRKRAAELAERARAAEPNSLEVLSQYSVTHSAMLLHNTRPDFADIIAKQCSAADRMLDIAGDDRRSWKEWVRCAERRAEFGLNETDSRPQTAHVRYSLATEEPADVKKGEYYAEGGTRRLDELRAVLARDPDNGPLTLELANIEVQMGQYYASQATLALQNNNKDDAAYYKDKAADSFVAARSKYKRLIEDIYSNPVDGLTNLASVSGDYLTKGEKDDVVSDLMSAIRYAEQTLGSGSSFLQRGKKKLYEKKVGDFDNYSLQLNNRAPTEKDMYWPVDLAYAFVYADYCGRQSAKIGEDISANNVTGAISSAKFIRFVCGAYVKEFPQAVWVRLRIRQGFDTLFDSEAVRTAQDPELRSLAEFGSEKGSRAATQYLLAYTNDEAEKSVLVQRAEQQAGYKFRPVLATGKRRHNGIPVEVWQQSGSGQRLMIKDIRGSFQWFQNRMVDQDQYVRICKASVIARDRGIPLANLKSAIDDGVNGDGLGFDPRRYALDQYGVVLGGIDPISLANGQPVAGLPTFALYHDHALWLFDSLANRELFQKMTRPVDPAAKKKGKQERPFALGVGGFDALALTRGELRAVSPTISWRDRESGKLFVFASQADLASWKRKSAENRKLAERNYEAMSAQVPAAGEAIGASQECQRLDT